MELGPVIYKITSPSNKVYIGQTWNYNQRYKSYEKLKCKSQAKLYSSFLSHGFENHKFEIIIDLPKNTNQEMLNTHEKFYWNLYKSNGYDMINLREPNGSRGKHCEESKKKMSEFRRFHPMSRESIEKMRNTKLGSKLSEETKRKMSIVRIGHIGYNRKYDENLIREAKLRIIKGEKLKNISKDLEIHYSTLLSIKQKRSWNQVEPLLQEID